MHTPATAGFRSFVSLWFSAIQHWLSLSSASGEPCFVNVWFKLRRRSLGGGSLHLGGARLGYETHLLMGDGVKSRRLALGAPGFHSQPWWCSLCPQTSQYLSTLPIPCWLHPVGQSPRAADC